MLTSFFRLYSRHLLVAALLLTPWLAIQSDSLPANNNIETWLPADSSVREAYQGFTAEFGAEELILVGLVDRQGDDPLVEAVATRLEQLPGVRQCWTPERLKRVITDLGVPSEEAERRLRGLATSHDSSLTGIIAMISEEGIKDRPRTVASVREQLAYCSVGEDQFLLSGAPIVVAELDRLGGAKANRGFFLAIFGLAAILLYYLLRDWKLALGVVAITFWGVLATNTAIKLLGGEMNFILSALPVMVLIFTLSVAVHFLHYYRSCVHSRNPVGEAIHKAIRPCFWASLTTVIGLLSLMVSDIAPVRQFGWAASVGAVMSMLTALIFTPALVSLCPQALHSEGPSYAPLTRLANAIITYRRPVVVACVSLSLMTLWGLPKLHSKIDPVEFLPKGSTVVRDLLRIEKELTPAESIEAVVDFGVRDLPFMEKLQEVRQIETDIAAQSGVKHTISLATFFPDQMPDSALESMRILGKASSQAGQNDFVSAGERYWRISARVTGTPDEKFQVYQGLQTLTEKYPVHFTGLAPLLVHAQRTIFEGFWESFATAFLIITGVMIISLRSIKIALIAMIPNVTPITIVFGLLGWFNIPVDIGMMMTASIALGIAVDGTFHFVMTYRRSYDCHRHSTRAARYALFHTGAPIFQAAMIASIGMLALAASQFTPTMRFGLLMSALMFVALLGDLVMLPALLALRRSRPTKRALAERGVAADSAASAEQSVRGRHAA
ncbi:MAG: efflux RND transporter permease subunit [Planctomycetaceae bacterium]